MSEVKKIRQKKGGMIVNNMTIPEIERKADPDCHITRVGSKQVKG